MEDISNTTKYWLIEGIRKTKEVFSVDPSKLIFSTNDPLNKEEFINNYFYFNKSSEKNNFNNLVTWLKNNGKEFDIVKYKNWILFNNFGDSRTLYKFLYNREYSTALKLGLDPIPKFAETHKLRNEIVTILIKKQIKTKRIRLNDSGNFEIYDPLDRVVKLSDDLIRLTGKDELPISELKKLSEDNEDISELVESFWRSDTAKFCAPKVMEYIKFLADKNSISYESLKREVMSKLFESPINISSPISAVTNSAPPSPTRSSSDSLISPRVLVGGLTIGRKLSFDIN